MVQVSGLGTSNYTSFGPACPCRSAHAVALSSPTILCCWPYLGPTLEVSSMKKLSCISMCTILVWLGAVCGTAEAKGRGLVLTRKTLTRNRYSAPRLSHKQYRGSHYSPVQFSPRRYAWQRNLGKLTGFKPVPKPNRATHRIRKRLVVRGATTRRREATRIGVVRRRESRGARIRTRWSGFGTHR